LFFGFITYKISGFGKNVDAKRTANGRSAIVKFEDAASSFCWRVVKV